MVNFTRPDFEFTGENFGDKVAAEFPSLAEQMIYWNDGHLYHLQMSDFYRFAEDAALSDDKDKLTRCLVFLEHVFDKGADDIKNAVYVSFLEHIRNGSTMYNALTPKLQKACDEIRDYLESCAAQDASARKNKGSTPSASD